MGLEVFQGDFLQGLRESHTLVLATGNGVVRRDGTLVMGAGSAKALARRFPALPARLGELLGGPGIYRYGLLVAREEDHLVGVFQTKGDWRHPASLDLIAFSAEKLRAFLEARPDLTVHLAFPGVGLGGLAEEEVFPALNTPLDGFRVVLWRKVL